MILGAAFYMFKKYTTVNPDDNSDDTVDAHLKPSDFKQDPVNPQRPTDELSNETPSTKVEPVLYIHGTDKPLEKWSEDKCNGLTNDECNTKFDAYLELLKVADVKYTF